jgi:hypothetical protein
MERRGQEQTQKKILNIAMPFSCHCCPAFEGMRF